MYPVYYVEAGDTLPILFDTFDGGTGASITLTGLAVTDIEIYKDGSVTQRASDAGYTLLDTDGIDFDGTTGIHGFSINLSDNTDAGFYAVGSWYHVVVSSVTVDAQTVNFIAAAFRIVSATRGLAGTALPDAAADAAGGLPISDAGGLDLDAKIGALTFTAANKVDANVTAWLGTAPATPTVAGVPEVDVTHVAGSTTDVSTIPASVAAILVDTGTTLQAELDGIQADTEDIQTRLPAALTAGGNMKSDALAFSGSTTAADNAETVFDTDFATNYITATMPHGWSVRLANGAHGGNAAALTLTLLSAETNGIVWNSDWDAEVQSEAADALAVYDPPTNAEMEARTLAAAAYGTAANQSTIITHLTDIKGATFSGATDSLEAIRNQGDSAWVTATSVTVSDKTGFKLASDGLDAVLIESSITAGATLTDDAGTQLTSINARQALSLTISSLGGVLAGAATTNVTIKPAGKAAGNTRVDATVDADGNRSALTLKVPT